ncbi:PadR family transcriptional regulator [bacterium]|nr:PadR family transcriptional regulator [bacterium]
MTELLVKSIEVPRKLAKGGTPAIDAKSIEREFLLSFWKIHILHHAAKKPVVGQWMIRELRHHGYEVSPGTLYPLLKRLEQRGWLSSMADPDGGLRARREYALTPAGHEVLAILRGYLKELKSEVL